MGRILGFTLFVLGVISAVVLALIATVAVPVSLNGTASRITVKPVEAGQATKLRSLPAQPQRRWEVDADALFGKTRSIKYMMVRAADEDMAVVAGVPEDQGPAPIMAVDTEGGAPLWKEPSLVPVQWCAISRDKKLACLRNGQTATSSSQVAFLDPATGKELRTITIDAPGTAKMSRAGDGFVVWTSEYDEISKSSQATIAWMSSDGSKQWTRKPRVEEDDVTLSEAGNVLAVRDNQDSVSMYQLDTGAVLYDSAGDQKVFKEEADKRSRIGEVNVYVSAIPHAGGFAVSFRSIYSSVVKFYDNNGIHLQDVKDIQLPSYADGTEGTAVVFQREDRGSNYTSGVISATTFSVVWEASSDFTYSTDIEMVAGTFVVESDYDDDQKKWQIYRLSDGTKLGSLTTSIYQKIVGSDGERIVYEGDRTSEEPGPGALTGYDSATGREVWRVKSTESADNVNVRFVGPNLYWYNARTTKRHASVIQYG